MKNAYLRLQLAVLIASGTGLFGRLVSIGELPLVLFRVMIGAAVLAVIKKTSSSQWKWGGGLEKRTVARIMGCGILLSVHWVFFYGSIKAANVSIGAVCFALVGFLTAIMEPLINHHRPNGCELLLSAISAVGIGLIFGLDPRYRLGIGLGVVSSVLYTLFSIYSKRVQSASGVQSSTMLLYEMVGGAAVLAVAAPIYSMVFPETSMWPQGNDVWLLLVFATVFTVVPFLLQLQALRRLSAFTVNLTYNLEPVYTIILASLLFGEAKEVGLPFWAGIMLITLSVVLQMVRSARMTAQK